MRGRGEGRVEIDVVVEVGVVESIYCGHFWVGFLKNVKILMTNIGGTCPKYLAMLNSAGYVTDAVEEELR